MPEAEKPRVDIIMGSITDYETMKHASEVLTILEIRHRVGVVSAHRTPDWLSLYTRRAEEEGIEIIIAGAGGAAALPGDIAARTILPVLAVPIETSALRGIDSMLSIQQMPADIPVGALAIGVAGARNTAWLAARILGLKDERLEKLMREQRKILEARVVGMNADLHDKLTAFATLLPLDWLSLEQKS